MFFRVLGAVGVVRSDGAPVVLRAAKQRVLLSALLLNANEWVRGDQLIDFIWGETPPRSAVANLKTYVWELRRLLAEDRITSGQGGYRIAVARDELDVFVFTDQVRHEEFAEALSLWRGEPFGELAAGGVDAVRGRLLESWFHAQEGLAAAELAAGRHAHAVAALRGLVADHPFREESRGMLMMALYRAGRQAEALEVYEDGRRVLDEELGLLPGAELRRLHSEILNQDVALDLPRRVPVQLPADVRGFTGRDEMLRMLDDVLAGTSTTVVVSAIAGTAGVGKTALAVHWAHRIRKHFPDGQLYLNLRGHGAGSPLTPVQALERLLTALGVESGKSVDVDEAAAAYRSALADQRVLVVLDNAFDADQVRPLLPGTPGSLVLITSRNRLDGLVARDGAQRLVLDVLSRRDARGVLEQVLGASRVSAEPEAVRELVELCARLPLALRIAAANLLARPGRSVADYVTELRGGDLLAALTVPGDPDTAVRAALDLSYTAMDPLARKLFRLMGLVPGRDITPSAVTALADISQRDAVTGLQALAAAHLVDEHATGRFTFHDLLRLCALERCREEDPVEARNAALERMALHYGLMARDVMRTVDPRPYRDLLAGEGTEFPDEQAAMTWLDREMANLVAVAQESAQRGSITVATQLCVALSSHFERHRTMVEWIGTTEAVLAGACRVNDLTAQAYGLMGLASAYWSQCEYKQALVLLEQARPIVEADVEMLRTPLLANFGRTYISMGRLRDSADCYRQLLELARQTSNLPSLVGALAIYGDVHWELGELHRAYELHTESIAVAHSAGLRTGVALGETHAGRSAQALGLLDQAVEHYLTGLDLCREQGDPVEDAGNLANLSGAYRDLGRYDDALRTARESLAISTRIGMPRTQTSARHVLGSTYFLLHRYDEARVELETALHLSSSHPRGRWDTLVSLADLHHALGAAERARDLAEQALAGSRETGHRLIYAEALRVLAEIDGGELQRLDEALELHRLSGYRLGVERVLSSSRRS
ncbi:tetratricopeptide repeat protein [Lentzea tibetensis]|uniref:Tetratricopeptide repeat protein n=1 Tax=Lentzea tibetensis TaxID=2591470 RepID=A0A563EGJ6_9PSEU|nr:BTAD domain-containing putative transcriptional regulator [Lentzea tibetensis]TWP44903.1 tetratricopeptide repeat protein [Lentzea tibetensis]